MTMLNSLKRFFCRLLLGSTDRAARLALDANARLAMPPRALEQASRMPFSPPDEGPEARRASLRVIEGGLGGPAAADAVSTPRARPGDRLQKAI